MLFNCSNNNNNNYNNNNNNNFARLTQVSAWHIFKIKIHKTDNIQ